MQRLLEYLAHHPFLSGGAALAALAVLAFEVQERVQAIAALSSVQVVRLMNQGALILDLRGKESYEAGHIGDARNVPAADLQSQADSLKKWRDKPVIAYDDSGVGGASAARMLTRLGFTRAFSLQGGLNGWLKDNLPLTKSAAGGKAGSK